MAQDPCENVMLVGLWIRCQWGGVGGAAATGRQEEAAAATATAAPGWTLLAKCFPALGELRNHKLEF